MENTKLKYPQIVGTYPGGTVTKISPKRWAVTAPDGRMVGSFPVKRLALEKAEDWDKWDAFASLQNIAFAMSPCTTTLIMKILSSGGKYIPTDQEMEQAVALDAILLVFMRLLKSDSGALQVVKEK